MYGSGKTRAKAPGFVDVPPLFARAAQGVDDRTPEEQDAALLAGRIEAQWHERGHTDVECQAVERGRGSWVVRSNLVAGLPWRIWAKLSGTAETEARAIADFALHHAEKNEEKNDS
jgi:hypothetical protein